MNDDPETLQLDRTQGRQLAAPAPVYRARYREYCDLPLASSQTGVRSVGHTSRTGLLSPDDPLRISLEQFEDLLTAAPRSVAEVISGGRYDRRDVRLRDGITSVASAFDTLTQGAFVAHAIGVAEALVDAQVSSDETTTSWKKRITRIKTLVGREHDDAVDRILQCRHKYVHGARQPDDDTLPVIALAVVVQVRGALAALYEDHSDHGDVERLIDAAALGYGTESSVADLFEPIASSIPQGPRTYRRWIAEWLRQGSA